MRRKSLTTKLIAVFLVAFVCLNAGGALCVAYCQSSSEAVFEQKDHCPLQKKSKQCDPEQQTEDLTVTKARSSEIECCSMTISFITAPIEKNSFAVKTPATALIVPFEPIGFAVRSKAKTTVRSAYSEPPLDRRVSRLKNGVIRI